MDRRNIQQWQENMFTLVREFGSLDLEDEAKITEWKERWEKEINLVELWLD